MRWIIPFGLLLSLALAGPCAQRPYTLETAYGLLGGNDLTYDGEALVFEGAACLEKEGIYLEAPSLRYLEATQSLEGEGLKGSAFGWKVQAEKLRDRTLIRPVLERERLKVEAEEALLEDPLKAQNLLLHAPAYRVRALRATLQREEVRLFGFLATPCVCGEGVFLKSEEVRFDPKTGEVLGDMTLGAYGLEVGLEEARANANRPPRLESPLVLSASETGGYTLGLDGLPIPRKGEEVGAWPLRLTLLLEGLSTEKEALRFGLREGGRGFEVRLGHLQGVRAFWDDLHAETTPRFSLRYAPRWTHEGLELRPFLAYTETTAKSGWTLGAEARYRWREAWGGFHLSLAPEALLALYPGQTPYLVLGGGVGLGYQEGGLQLSLSYGGRYEATRKEPEFSYESRDEFQRLSVEGGLEGFLLAYTLENPLGNRMDRLEARYQAPSLGRISLAYVRGSLEEVRLAYRPPEPGRDCREAVWFSPEVGFGGGGPSRYALEARYYDCCLAYSLRVSQVLKGQYTEATGFGISLGLWLR
ncbi:MAG: hypothetical protein ACUVS9_05070 [Thermaceae bacterium]